MQRTSPTSERKICVDIHMEQHHGDGDYWCIEFISKGFEFTEGDLTAVCHGVGSYHSGWHRADGLRRTNRIVVSCTKEKRPGPTAQAYRALKRCYPNARFTMHDRYLRESLTKQGLDIVTP